MGEPTLANGSPSEPRIDALNTTRPNLANKLESTGQEWQFYIATDIYWSRMVISHCY